MRTRAGKPGEFCADPFATKSCDGDRRPWLASIKERLETYPDFRGLDFCGQENGVYAQDPAELRIKRLIDQVRPYPNSYACSAVQCMRMHACRQAE